MNSGLVLVREILKRNLNRCFCDGGQRRFSYQHLLNLAERDKETLIDSLHDWEHQGFIRLLAPVDAATLDDVMEMITYIEVDPKQVHG